MIKLVIFDWNGTLIADTRACMDTDNEVIKAFGGNPVDLKTYRDTIIIPAIDFYTQHGCDRKELEADFKRVGKIFHDYYEPRVANCRTRRSVREVLKSLKQKSIESIILSNHTLEGIQFQLTRLKISDYIARVLANSEKDSSMRERNKQRRLTQYLELGEYESNEITIVGDSPEEVEIGKALGLRTVAITGGYYSTSRLRASNPDYLITNIKELIAIIQLS